MFEDYETQSSQWMNVINVAIVEDKTSFAEKHKTEEKSGNSIENEDV